MNVLQQIFWCSGTLLLTLFTGSYAQNNDLPKEFRQIIPRGRIAAISQPTFVTAPEADIGGDSWVLGVVIDGQAKAYSLTLLNSHEIVNDRIGDTNFAAVW